jgi:hypothetical protein
MKRRLGIAGAAGAVLTLLAVIFGVQEGQIVRRFDPDSAYEIAATQDIAYRLADRNPRPLGATIDNARTWMRHHRGDGYRIRRENTMEWSIARPAGETARHLRDVLRRVEVRTVVYVRAEADDIVLHILKVDLNPAMVIDTEGTLAIDVIVGTTVVRFPSVQSLGIYACRYIAGTHELSEHAAANAWDIGGTTALLDRVAEYQLQLWRKGYLPVSQILWDGRNLISGSPVADHYSHIHDSGDPLLHPTRCMRADRPLPGPEGD